MVLGALSSINKSLIGMALQYYHMVQEGLLPTSHNAACVVPVLLSQSSICLSLQYTKDSFSHASLWHGFWYNTIIDRDRKIGSSIESEIMLLNLIISQFLMLLPNLIWWFLYSAVSFMSFLLQWPPTLIQIYDAMCGLFLTCLLFKSLSLA